MIEMELLTAVGKPSDLKVCQVCKWLNWYENESCRNVDCDSDSFHEDHKSVTLAVQSEYDFYMTEEGMTEEQVDHIYIEL